MLRLLLTGDEGIGAVYKWSEAVQPASKVVPTTSSSDTTDSTDGMCTTMILSVNESIN